MRLDYHHNHQHFLPVSHKANSSHVLTVLEEHFKNMDVFWAIFPCILGLSELFHGVCISKPPSTNRGPLNPVSSNGNGQLQQNQNSGSVIPYIYYILLTIVRTICTVIFVNDSHLLALLSMTHPGVMYRIFENKKQQNSDEIGTILEGIFSPILSIAFTNMYFVYIYVTYYSDQNLPVDQLYLNSFLISLFLLRMIGFVLGKLSQNLTKTTFRFSQLLNLVLLLAVFICLGVQLRSQNDKNSADLTSVFNQTDRNLITIRFLLILIAQPFLLRILSMFYKFETIENYLLQIYLPDSSIALGLVLWSSNDPYFTYYFYPYAFITITQLFISSLLLVRRQLNRMYSIDFTCPKKRRCYDVRKETQRANLALKNKETRAKLMTKIETSSFNYADVI